MSPDAWRSRSGPSTLVRSATIIAAAFVVSRVLGLAREIIIAYQFGTSGETSAYVAAFKIPDLIFLVIMAGSFGSAFIPVFSGFLVQGDDEKAWALASAVLNVAVISTLVGGAIVFVAADPLVRYVVAPNLAPEYQALTVDLMRFLLLSPVLLGLGIAAKGILEAQDRFVLPALAPLVYNASIVLGALFLAPSMGINGLVVGVIFGALLHAGIQVPGLIRAGMRYRPSVRIRTEGIEEVIRLLLPRIVGQAAFQVNFIVVFAFASGLGDAHIAALNFAWQLLMLPHGVIALSISTVIFPTMARLYKQGRLDDLSATFRRALRPLVFLSLPAAVGLFFYRTAIVQSLFQAGAFSSASTDLVASALALFALGLVSYAVVEVLTRAFYAMHDTRTPVIAGLLTIAVNIALSAVFVGRFGLTGLAMSLSLTTTIEGIILVVVLRRRLPNARIKSFDWPARVAGATAAMAGVAWLTAPVLTAATRPGQAARLAQLALFGYALVVTGLTYLVAAYLLKLPELDVFVAKVDRRFRGTERLRRLAGR